MHFHYYITQSFHSGSQGSTKHCTYVQQYPFHTPLDILTVLAVQNMEANGLFGKGNERDIEITALEGSLSMMSKGKSSLCTRTLFADVI